MNEPDQIAEYLQRLTPLARSNLLTELERLEACGAGLPGSTALLEKLRAEFRDSGQIHVRVSNPSRNFFMPLEPLLVNGAPRHANSGRISRGSLAPIWQWITHDLLPAMARDYEGRMRPLIASDNQREAARVAATFQVTVLKYLENTLRSPDSADQIRSRLAAYTTSPTVSDDLIKMMSVLRARDALAKLGNALPPAIEKLDDPQLAKVIELLDAFRKTNPEALCFALALVASRLKPSWQLIHLPVKVAPSKSVMDVAATPYALAVSMVLEHMDDKRSELNAALRRERVLVAKELLTEIYDAEYALRARIDLLPKSDWGERLQKLMDEIDVLVEAEISRFPDQVDHVLSSCRPRSQQSMSARLADLASKGRDAVSGGAAFYRKLIGQS
jgi:hypothetical protein